MTEAIPATSLPHQPYMPHHHSYLPDRNLNYRRVMTSTLATPAMMSEATPKAIATSFRPPTTTTPSPATVYKQRMKEYFKKNPEKFKQYYQQLQAYHSSQPASSDV